MEAARYEEDPHRIFLHLAAPGRVAAGGADVKLVSRTRHRVEFQWDVWRIIVVPVGYLKAVIRGPLHIEGVQRPVQVAFILVDVSRVASSLSDRNVGVGPPNEPAAGGAEELPINHHVAAVFVPVLIVEQLLRYRNLAREIDRSTRYRLGLFRGRRSALLGRALTGDRQITARRQHRIGYPSRVVSFDLVPEGTAAVGAFDFTAVAVAIQLNRLTRLDLTDRLPIRTGAWPDIGVVPSRSGEHCGSDLVCMSRWCHCRHSSCHGCSQAEKCELSDLDGCLTHRDPPRTELRQSSDRNFDVLHDVLLASDGGTRVHPIRAPGAI